MADPAFLPLKEFKSTKDISFEENVKKYISWSKKDWSSSQYAGSHWNRYVASLKFWNYKLRDAYNDSTLLITLYNDSYEAFINMESLLEAIKQIIPFNKISGFFKVRNPRIIGMEFVDAHSKELVEKNLKMVGRDSIGFLHWADNDGNINLSVHWIPLSVPTEKIIEVLDKYIDITKIDFEKVDFNEGKGLKSGKYNIKGKMKNKGDIDAIPHLFNVGKLQGLITVRGRAPLCLCCENVGHIATDCPTPYCRSCRLKRPIKHTCKDQKDTYANILKDSDEEDFMNCYIDENKKCSDSKKKVLSVVTNNEEGKDGMGYNIRSKVKDNSHVIEKSNKKEIDRKQWLLDIPSSEDLAQHAPYVIDDKQNLGYSDSVAKEDSLDRGVMESKKSDDITDEVFLDESGDEIQKKNKKRSKQEKSENIVSNQENINRQIKVYGKQKSKSVRIVTQNVFSPLSDDSMEVSASEI